MFKKLLITAVAFLSCGCAAFADSAPRIVNIINFVRETEPRPRGITNQELYETTVSELRCMQENGLHGTFLLQYDALIDPKYQELMRSLPANFEVGGWWEITQPHVEAAGMKWRGRYPWDWHANVGFATGYTPGEREKLVDVYMEKFKDAFGKYPESVGSWFIDAHTLKYMYDKYHIVASCNCRDQVGTDGYTLWGGYWQGGYYPSVNNAYIPAQTREEQINVPVFRMLGSDPVLQYDSEVGGTRQNVYTLEPVSQLGMDEKWTRWFVGSETQGFAIGYTYFQAGQENSFTWKRINDAFAMQMREIAATARAGNLRVETLGESGRNFAARHKLTPPTAWEARSQGGIRAGAQTLWFSTRHYRANLYLENGAFRFRDIQLYNEDNRSPYLDAPGTSSECHYCALPFVDGCLWSDSSHRAGLRIMRSRTDGKYREIVCAGMAVSKKGEDAIAKLTDESGEVYAIALREKSITVKAAKDIDFHLSLQVSPKAILPFMAIHSQTAMAAAPHDGFKYVVNLRKGTFQDVRGSRSEAFRILPQNGKIELSLTQEQSQ